MSMASKDIVLSLFDKTGIAVRPWVEAGYRAVIVDIQHGAAHGTWDHGVLRLAIDIRNGFVLPAEFKDRVAFVFAFPPCDHLAVSGARWFKGKGLRKLALSIDLFATAAEVCDALGAPYCIENPVSTISTYWRKPDYTFDPYEYTGFWADDNYTKRTCLWVGNDFKMPPAYRLDSASAPDNRIHACPPSDERANIRSASPVGFTKAVFEYNAVLGLV